MSDKLLTGHHVVLTGASRGIGRAVARCLAAHGATLALIARDEGALEQTRVSLPGGPHEVFAFDVSDEQAWDRAGPSLMRTGTTLDLVTAAAVIGPIGSIGSWRVAEFRSTIEVNVLGTVLAIATCLPNLSGGSVVTFSGGGATSPLPRFDAYAASKAAVVRLTENLAVDLGTRGVRFNAVAPGFVLTDIHRDELAAGPEVVGSEYYERTRLAFELGVGDAPELAASLTCFLLSDAAQGISGKLLSARWDAWQDPEFQRRLREENDLATLRRIDDQAFRAIEDRP